MPRNDHRTANTPRRGFLGRLGALLALGSSPSLLAAAPSAPKGTFAPDERWLLEAAQKEHKLFIEAGSVGDLVSLRRAMNFLDAYKADYAIDEKDLGLIVGFHGDGIALALGDALWTRHGLGARLNLKAADGTPLATHPARKGAPHTMEALTARGVHFLACNNSLRRLSRQLAGPSGNAEEMHRSLVAGVEGMQVVPAMAVAVSRAQERGIPYLAIP